MIELFIKIQLRTTERHLPYGTISYRTQVNAFCDNASQTTPYSIYLPWRDGRLS